FACSRIIRYKPDWRCQDRPFNPGIVPGKASGPRRRDFSRVFTGADRVSARHATIPVPGAGNGESFSVH
ncbi:MAG: hypothetical protein ABFD97_03405, partial [Syntrophobacter sp.]